MSRLFEDQPVAALNTLPRVSDDAFDGAVLDLDQLPAPVTDNERVVHTVARQKFAALRDMLERQERGEFVAMDEYRVAESDATELLLAYKRLLAQRVG